MRFMLLWLFGIILGAAAMAQTPENNPKNNVESKYQALATFATVLEMVHSRYVDSDKATYEKLIQSAIRGMMEDLDIYTGFEDQDEFQQTSQVLNGMLTGIGVVISKEPDLPLRIVTTAADSPAFEAGLKENDLITAIENQNTAPLKLTECLKLIQGKSGSTVKLQISRGSEKPFWVNLIRQQINIGTIPEQGIRKLTKDIGYIRITVFNTETPSHFDNAMKKLMKKNISALVIDLRNNPGGLMDSAIALASRFLPPGSIIMHTSSRDRKNEQTIKASDKVPNRVPSNIQVAVLVNEYSASAAEIFAGALNDNRRAKIIGARTFGKGTVQQIQQLPDGSAIRMTIGRYLTPSKEVIQNRGITPDVLIKVPLNDRAVLNLQLILHPGIIEPSEGRGITDYALKKAVSILSGEKH